MRRLGALVACAAVLPAAACAGPPVTEGAAAGPAGARRTGSDWPTFLGPGGDGKSPETGLRWDWPPEGPPLLWQVEVGSGYSMASVAGGRLFLFDRAGDRARLRCLDPETGAERWQAGYTTGYEDLYGFSDGPRTTPVVHGDRVFTYGVEGRLRAHAVADGALLWEVDTAARFGVVQNFFGVGGTPLVVDDLLIVPVGGSPPDSPGVRSGEVKGNGSGLVAFDLEDGRVRWRSSDELASYASPAVAEIGGRPLGLYFARGGLLGFRPADGEVRFRFLWRARKVESVNASNPVLAGDLLFLSESYGPGSALLRLTGGAPEVVWKDPPRPKSLKLHWMTPIHHDGHLYASSGSGSGDAELRCVELRTGAVRWRERGLGRSTMLFADGRLVVLTEYGTLLVVAPDPERFRTIAEAVPEDDAGPLLKHPAWNPPILAHGLLYARGADRLACFDLRP